MIDLLLDKRLATIEPELFGCLIENYGTLLDGIWVGNDADIPHDDGLRRDAIAALRELGIGVIRFPGGTPADHYRWRDGIGPRSERPRTWQFFFGGEDDNAFGTHEFVQLCEKVGATPSIKLNPISGTLHEALEWMQYCNYNGDTDLANKRRVNGHDVAALSAHGIDIEPGGKFHMLALKYPNEQTLTDAIALIDRYFDGRLEICVEEWEGQTAFTLGWPQEWLDTMSIFEIVLHQGRANLTYENEARLDGALMAAEKMHRWMRHAEHVKMATYLYPTNTWAPLLKSRGADLIRTPHYQALAMLRAHAGAEAVAVEVDAGESLDIMASTGGEGKELTVSLLNQDAEKAVAATLQVQGKGVLRSVKASVLTGDGADENTFESPERIAPAETAVAVRDGRLSLSCPPMSLTAVQCELAE